MAKDWGECNWCKKPSECCRYWIEIGALGFDVCEPCYEKWQAKLNAALKSILDEFAV